MASLRALIVSYVFYINLYIHTIQYPRKQYQQQKKRKVWEITSTLSFIIQRQEMQQNLKKVEEDANIPQQETIQQKAPEKAENSCSNEYATEYREKMSPFTEKIAEQLCNLKQLLHKKNIGFNPDSQIKATLSVDFQGGSINKQVMLLNLSWGQFSIKAKMLNSTQQNLFHDNHSLHPRIFKGNFKGQPLTVKCIPVLSDKTRSQALKQWFLLKLASQAGFGPKIHQYFDFDLLMYSSCVQFAMETCLPVRNHLEKNQFLYKHLAFMHSFHIVHQDIKPGNIMFSPSQKKLVFIDFGLSRIIKESPGSKSVTYFTGTIGFCSKEMSHRFREKNSRPVDLYYNDLYGFQASLQVFKNSKEQIDVEYEKRPQIQQMEQFFFHLRVALLKALLFKSNQIEAINQWKNLLVLEPLGEQKIRREILAFLLELLPNDQLTTFFWYFATESYFDLPAYCNLKVLYEARVSNTAAAKVLLDSGKTAEFQKYLEECQKETGCRRQEEQKRMQAVLTLVNSPEIAKISPFPVYVESLLEYLSFFRNSYHVTELEREKALKMYAELFLSKNSQVQSNEMPLSEQVFRHMLEKIFSSSEILKDEPRIPIIIFRLVQFLFILDLGQPEEIVQWLQQFKNHPSILQRYTYIFVIKVQLLNYLNYHRITKKGDMCRTDFVQLIEKWIVSQSVKSHQLQELKSLMAKELESQQKTVFDTIFMKEFGQQIKAFFQMTLRIPDNSQKPSILKQIQNMKATYLLKQQLLKSQKYFYCYYLQIYVSQYLKRTDNNACKFIFQCFKANVADVSICSQFKFQDELNIIAERIKVMVQYKYFKPNELAAINQFYAKIDDKDLIFSRQVINALYNRIRFFLLKDFKLYESYFTGPSGLFYRFVTALKASIEKQHSINTIKHKSFPVLDIFFLLTMSKSLKPSRQKQILQFLSHKLQSQKDCSVCLATIKANILLSEIQNCVSSLFQQLKTPQSLCLEENNILDRLFKLTDELTLSVLKSDIPAVDILKVLENGYSLGQILCCLDMSIEEEYGGLRRYYQFVDKNGLYENYFKSEQQLNRPIYFTLALFSKTSFQKFVDLLYKLIQTVAKFRNLNGFIFMGKVCVDFLKQSPEQFKQNLFLALKYIDKQKQQKNFFLVTCYMPIHNLARSKKLLFQLQKQIIRSIPFLPNEFQRIVLIQLYSDICIRLHNPEKNKKDRQFKYINARLYKGLKIQGATSIGTPKCKKKYQKDIFWSTFWDKINRSGLPH